MTSRVRRGAAAAAVVATVAWVGLELVVRHGSLIDVHRFVRPAAAVRVLDRDGALLRVVRGDGVDQRWVPLAEVSPTLVSAVLAAEDRRFFGHHGVDVIAVLRAAVTNVIPWRRRSGASTLTQQLVKRVYGRPNGLWDKGIEMLRAMALERAVSKDEILEQYLNRLPYGDGIVGVARACEAYLGHGPQSLTPAEAALIAGIPQAPAHTEPRRHLARALRRRNEVLQRMVARGWITAAEGAAARSERFAAPAAPPHPTLALALTDRVAAGLRDGTLRAEDGAFTTSVDVALQADAEALLRDTVARVAGRGAQNGAAVVVRHDSGEVYAYVGAARRDAAGGAMDLLRAYRQPGSTLKPFVYERFFEEGGTPATVLSDVARSLGGHAGAQYDARDYDGRERGPVRARVALASSLNLAALDAAGRVGQDDLARRLRALGFLRAGDGAALGAAVVLGGLDVTPLELASAYATLARGGSHAPLRWTPGDDVAGTPLLHADAVAMTTDVLADEHARTEGFGRSLRELAPGAPFALKTGTSSGWRDAWCAVYDARWTVLVWLGDPSGAPMSGVSGFEAAAPTAVRLLARARAIPRPGATRGTPSLREVTVCAHSGLRAGPRCTQTVRERLPDGALRSAVCEAHDAHGRDLVDARYARWAREHHAAVVSRGTEATAPLRVVVPEDGARLLAGRAGDRLRLRAEVGGAEPEGLRWEMDGRAVETSWEMSPGRHVVEAIAADGARARSAFEVARVP
ncbi:MAG: transglycosylase domain-containing protein [Polyangiales bacterium]